jgi:hypothetical protein
MPLSGRRIEGELVLLKDQHEGYITWDCIVTLSNGERKKPAALDISSGRDGTAASIERIFWCARKSWRVPADGSPVRVRP